MKKEVGRFLVSGFSAVATDLLVYKLLSGSIDVNVAKGISFLSGTMLAFILNKYWTFQAKEKSYSEAGKFALLYGLSLCLNVLVNKIALYLFSNQLFAFLCATGASTVLNFIGQKFWVFKNKQS